MIRPETEIADMRSWSPHAMSIMTLIDPRSRNITTADVLEAVSSVTGISLRDMGSNLRAKHLCRARFVYYRLSRELTSASLPMIGRRCGGRDHSTVMHGIKVTHKYPRGFKPLIEKVLLCLGQPICTLSARPIDSAYNESGAQTVSVRSDNISA